MSQVTRGTELDDYFTKALSIAWPVVIQGLALKKILPDPCSQEQCPKTRAVSTQKGISHLVLLGQNSGYQHIPINSKTGSG